MSLKEKLPSLNSIPITKMYISNWLRNGLFVGMALISIEKIFFKQYVGTKINNILTASLIILLIISVVTELILKKK